MDDRYADTMRTCQGREVVIIEKEKRYLSFALFCAGQAPWKN